MLTTILALVLGSAQVGAYTPAVPTNNTNAVNQSDMSSLSMKWAPAGTYSNTVSFQLSRSDSEGFDQGALVHFTEKNLTDANTTTPWIALINCDANATDASQEDDIFTLAQERGATAALLYSLTAEACLINPEYSSPPFNQILDIFATQSRSSAQIINSQFMNLHNISFANYDPVQLNNSASAVEASLQASNVTSAFIVATLRAANSTINPNGTDTGTDSPSSTTKPRGNPNTGLAMIILYAITGCVSALFIIVILSGAIRAIRHPERYGPRSGTMNGDAFGGIGQSRTGGIGRAILDTFPIIKFAAGGTSAEPKGSDVESSAPPIEMTARNADDEKDGKQQAGGGGDGASPGSPVAEKQPDAPVGGPFSTSETQAAESSSSTPSQTSGVGASAAHEAETKPANEEVSPGAIGHETCPICIVDFEQGDDLRVLPCEGKHKFHQACVDPWLLELSSSCPLCREDFHALESMIAGNEGGVPEARVEEPVSSSAVHSSRFSKYLKFARRRNRALQPAVIASPEPSDVPPAGSSGGG